MQTCFNGSLCSSVAFVRPISGLFINFFCIFKRNFFLFSFSSLFFNLPFGTFWCFIVYKLTGSSNCIGHANTFAQKITGHDNRNAKRKE